MRLAHLAQRLFNVPLAIHPRKAEIAMAALADRLNLASITPHAWADDDDFDFTSSRETRGAKDPGYDVENGVAVIPVKGTTVQRTGSLRPYSGMTGYDGLREAYMAAISDPQVRAIALDIDSPGGEVAGLFDLTDAMFDARREKPTCSILSESAFSAGYAIAAASGGPIFVPRTGGTGSVGIVCMHVDFSQALDKNGLKVTFFHYGAKKVDGHSEVPLTEGAAADIQADINTMGELFTDTVARYRGLAASKVKAMEAATFLGAAGVDQGLADAVLAPDAAMNALLAELG